MPVLPPLGHDADTDPGEGDVMPTRTHGVPATSRRDEVPTRPEGVIAVRAARKQDEAHEVPTDPHGTEAAQRREEKTTRPEGVMAIRRPRGKKQQ